MFLLGVLRLSVRLVPPPHPSFSRLVWPTAVCLQVWLPRFFSCYVSVQIPRSRIVTVFFNPLVFHLTVWELKHVLCSRLCQGYDTDPLPSDCVFTVCVCGSVHRLVKCPHKENCSINILNIILNHCLNENVNTQVCVRVRSKGRASWRRYNLKG